MPIDCRAARAELARRIRRLHSHGRHAVLTGRATLAHLSRAPAHHVARNRRQLHQLLRELRASARRVLDGGRSLTGTQLLRARAPREVRAQTSDTVRRRRELERLALALAAHDPSRTLARGYALVEARDGEPLGSGRRRSRRRRGEPALPRWRAPGARRAHRRMPRDRADLRDARWPASRRSSAASTSGRPACGRRSTSSRRAASSSSTAPANSTRSARDSRSSGSRSWYAAREPELTERAQAMPAPAAGPTASRPCTFDHLADLPIRSRAIRSRGCVPRSQAALSGSRPSSI